jgi:protein ImuB
VTVYIPSYDDLTPSIPDAAAVARNFSSASDAAAVARSFSSASDVRLYACVRSERTPDVIVAIAQDFSPRIQRYGATAVVLDVSGLGRLLGDPKTIGSELYRAGRERSNAVAVSIAPTQSAALLLARLQPLTVVTDNVGVALAAVPLTVFRQTVEDAYAVAHEVFEQAFDVLRLWGLTTVGEFAALPAVALSERMGQSGLALQRMARGIDPAPLVPDPGTPRFVQSIALEWPIEQLEPLSFVLARLLEPLSASLERADRGAAAIRVDLRLTDRTTHRRVLQLPAAMRDPRVLRTLVQLDLESHPPSAAIDVVTIEVDPAPARIIQYSLLERARPSVETVATLTARLSALVGESRSGCPFVLDTHRPDGFEMRRFAPAEERSTGPVGCPSVSLRRFRAPIAIRVAVERGRPVSVAIDRRGMPGGRIARAAGPWRTSGAWWDGEGAHWDRDEWDVAFAEGALCRIFRDRIGERWFLEGVID